MGTSETRMEQSELNYKQYSIIVVDVFCEVRHTTSSSSLQLQSKIKTQGNKLAILNAAGLL